MTTFDAIATQTVRTAGHLEPAFVHALDIEIAKRKLAGRKKKPTGEKKGKQQKGKGR